MIDGTPPAPVSDTLAPLPAIAAATLTLTRIYDVGYAVDLDRAHDLLAADAIRPRPSAGVRQSASIQIAQTPLRVDLAAATVEIEGVRLAGQLRASVYDLGAITIALTLPLPPRTSWEAVADLFASAQEPTEEVERGFREALDGLETLIRPAIERPERSPLDEDYSVLMIERLDPPGETAALEQHPLVRSALLGERRTLGRESYAAITSMNYYPDDLALLSWNGALMVEPDPNAAATVLELLEFANVELLLLRSYDADLEKEIHRLNERISAVHGRPYLPIVGRYTRLLNEAQRTVFEISEVTERIDNAYRVTDDVYWNRLYSAALGVLRVGLWRTEVEQRLSLIRESYMMLRDRAESDRSASLEWIVILLIAFEIVMALFVQ